MNANHAIRKFFTLATLAYIAAFLFMLNTGCKHQPLFDDDGLGPIDTTDTTDTLVIVDTIPDGIPCDPDTVYFEVDVLPILISNCAMSGCHNAGSHEDGVVLDNYQNVMNTGEIAPFNPGGSELYEAITETDPEDRMPPPPAAALSAAQKAIIAKWINQGAQNLSCNPNYGECDTVDVSYSQAIKPVIDTYCKGCHSGSNPSGNIGLENYNSIKTVALNGKLYGSISWSSGYVKMPQGG
ncbi:MAG: hypothetical protein MUC59_16035, partial [Saprospiraceae bacterium]|nr:hypothetical protein [Saprospiraceae bacterium]